MVLRVVVCWLVRVVCCVGLFVSGVCVRMGPIMVADSAYRGRSGLAPARVNLHTLGSALFAYVRVSFLYINRL